jgi:polyisoprenyl-phosphate glycosyltransferase
MNGPHVDQHTAPKPSPANGGDPPVDLSIVIPVYNSSRTLKRLVEELFVALDRERLAYEIVFVDDSSPDTSWSVLKELQALHPDRITCIQLMRNFGQHSALMCGFRHARGQYVVTMDDDLQNPPSEIPRLWKAIHDTGVDLVYGSYESKKHASLRNLGSILVNVFFRLVFGLGVTVTSFRIIRQDLLQTILPYSLNFAYVDGLFAWNTRRIGSVPVQHQARPVGRSGYSVAKLLKLAFNLFTNFSLLPLQVVSLIGFIFAVGGLTAALWYLILFLMGEIVVLGYASTIIAILVLGGVQLLSLGMIGEYVGRLHLNVNRMPQYTIRETLSVRQSTPSEDAPCPT